MSDIKARPQDGAASAAPPENVFQFPSAPATEMETKETPEEWQTAVESLADMSVVDRDYHLSEVATKLAHLVTFASKMLEGKCYCVSTDNLKSVMLERYRALAKHLGASEDAKPNGAFIGVPGLTYTLFTPPRATTNNIRALITTYLPLKSEEDLMGKIRCSFCKSTRQKSSRWFFCNTCRSSHGARHGPACTAFRRV
jgi:hypothetical protein